MRQDFRGSTVGEISCLMPGPVNLVEKVTNYPADSSTLCWAWSFLSLSIPVLSGSPTGFVLHLGLPLPLLLGYLTWVQAQPCLDITFEDYTNEMPFADTAFQITDKAAGWTNTQVLPSIFMPQCSPQLGQLRFWLMTYKELCWLLQTRRRSLSKGLFNILILFKDGNNIISIFKVENA